MKESYYQENIWKNYQKEYPNSYWVKIAGGNYQKRGLPDIIGCIDGLFVGIEVKLPERRNELGAVTPLQQYALDQIHKAGGFTFVAYDVDDVLSILKEYFANAHDTAIRSGLGDELLR